MSLLYCTRISSVFTFGLCCLAAVSKAISAKWSLFYRLIDCTDPPSYSEAIEKLTSSEIDKKRRMSSKLLHCPVYVHERNYELKSSSFNRLAEHFTTLEPPESVERRFWNTYIKIADRCICWPKMVGVALCRTHCKQCNWDRVSSGKHRCKNGTF